MPNRTGPDQSKNAGSPDRISDPVGSYNEPGALSGYDFNQVNLGEEKLPNPATYWKYFGEDTPNLQKIAALIYKVQPSSAACERNFAHFDYVYTKRRQRLGTVKGDKIVFVYSNGQYRLEGMSRGAC